MTVDNKVKLQKLFDEGLVQEIFVADESYNILQTVKKRWQEISRDNYGIFFKSLNHAHFIRYSLSITKLFDREHSKYNVISLPTVVKFIDENLLNEEIMNPFLTTKWFAQKNRNHIYSNREDVDTSFFPKETLEHGQALLNFAKSFVTIFELAIFNALYSTDGSDYVLGNDSVMTNNAFLRLLESSKLIKGEDYNY